MKRNLFFLALLSIPIFAQVNVKQLDVKQLDVKQLTDQGVGIVSVLSSAHPVQGAPYSASVVNENIQTLADGNRIVQKTTGTTARDSQGRTRNDAGLPTIGNLSPAAAPHLAFIVDPVAQASYTLNLDEKTGTVAGTVRVAGVFNASEHPLPPSLSVAGAAPIGPITTTMSLRRSKEDLDREQAQTRTEDLGTQVMEGVSAYGVRTTRTIPAGEIGNDRPIDIVTEVWTSPDLKTIVMSKRIDPRSGEQTFRLTNIVRSEPDPSLFTVPADFKTVEGEGRKNVFFYQTKE